MFNHTKYVFHAYSGDFERAGYTHTCVFMCVICWFSFFVDILKLADDSFTDVTRISETYHTFCELIMGKGPIQKCKHFLS